MATCCLLCSSPEDLDGIKVYKACEISDGKPCLPCQQYIELEAQISLAKIALDERLLRKRKLRSEINHQHDSITHSLPPEIISSIFKSYVGEDIERNMWKVGSHLSPLALGAVCRPWRSIAWSSSSLWSHIDIFVPQPELWNCLEVTQGWLSMSGQLPLSIHFSCPSTGDQAIIESRIGRVLHGLTSTTNRYSSRWEKFLLFCPIELFPLFCGESQGAPIIRRLTLTSLEELDEVGDDLAFILTGPEPQPSCVQINRFWFRLLNINWSQVTKVLFDENIHLDECVELLRQAPQLLDCHIRNALYPKWTQPRRNVPIVHSKLQSLLFGDYRGDDLDEFFGVFSFPRLTFLELDWVFKDETADTIWDSTIGLIMRSSCPLKSLRLRAVEHNPEMLIKLLRETPCLRELEISGTIDIPNNDPCDLFCFLADCYSSSSTSSDKSGELFLPNLQSIHYGNYWLKWDSPFWALILAMAAEPHWEDLHDPLKCGRSKIYPLLPLSVLNLSRSVWTKMLC